MELSVGSSIGSAFSAPASTMLPSLQANCSRSRGSAAPRRSARGLAPRAARRSGGVDQGHGVRLHPTKRQHRQPAPFPRPRAHRRCHACRLSCGPRRKVRGHKARARGCVDDEVRLHRPAAPRGVREPHAERKVVVVRHLDPRTHRPLLRLRLSQRDLAPAQAIP